MSDQFCQNDGILNPDCCATPVVWVTSVRLAIVVDIIS